MGDKVAGSGKLCFNRAEFIDHRRQRLAIFATHDLLDLLLNVAIITQLDDSGNRMYLSAIGILGAELVISRLRAARRPSEETTKALNCERGRFRVFRPRLRLDESRCSSLLDAKPSDRLK